MNLQIIFLEEFGKAFVPKKIRSHLRGYFLKAGLVDVPYKVFGAFFYLSIITTFFLYFYQHHKADENHIGQVSCRHF